MNVLEKNCTANILKELKFLNIEFEDRYILRKNKPTLESIRKYFREILKIDVFASPVEFKGFLKWYGSYRRLDRTINNVFLDMMVTNYLDSYEEAVEKALLHVIKELKNG